MTFYTGQKIICVDAEGASMLQLNAEYTVLRVNECRLRRWRKLIREMSSLDLVEVAPEPGHHGFAPERFRPAVGRKTDIFVFKAMLTTKKVDA